MAAAAIIDAGMVLKIIATAFENVSGITRVHLGEPEPKGVSSWVRLQNVTLVGLPRQRASDEPHHQDFEAVFAAVVSEQKASRFAIGTAVAKLTAVFEGATFFDPSAASPEHQVDCQTIAAVLINVAEEERNIRVAEISVKGLVTRYSGTSVSDFLT